MPKLLPSLLAGLAAAALAGCGSPCQDLAERICNCQLTTVLRDECKASVGNQIKSATQKPDSEDQQRCSELLKTCPDPSGIPNQCDVLRTDEGRKACGLAY